MKHTEGYVLCVLGGGDHHISFHSLKILEYLRIFISMWILQTIPKYIRNLLCYQISVYLKWHLDQTILHSKLIDTKYSSHKQFNYTIFNIGLLPQDINWENLNEACHLQ